MTKARAATASAAPHTPLVYGGVMLGLLFLVWLVASTTGLAPARVLPSPIDVVVRFANLAVEPFSGATLAGHLLVSLQRWAIGVACAIALGVPLGVLLAWLPPLRPAIAPLFELIRYIPPFAWVPIAVLWFGASTTTQALVVFIAAFPACVINAQLGISEVDPILLRAGRMLGAGSLRALLRIALPVAAPAIFTGIRIAFSNGWMALVGAELVVGKQGLGFLISQGQINDSAATIIVGMVSIGIVGALLDVALQRAQHRLVPWLPRSARPTH
jgi:ABC-type nitrate/sulfonate/bicarbonate transport system permease component